MARTMQKPPTGGTRSSQRGRMGRVDRAVRALQLEAELRTDPRSSARRDPHFRGALARSSTRPVCARCGARRVRLQGHALGDGRYPKSLERDPQLKLPVPRQSQAGARHRLRSGRRLGQKITFTMASILEEAGAWKFDLSYFLRLFTTVRRRLKTILRARTSFLSG